MNISAFFPLNLGAAVSEIIAPHIEDLWFLCIISVNIHKDPRPDATGVSPMIFPQRVLREGERTARSAGKLKSSEATDVLNL